jgi:hypothetical protein
MPSFQKFLDFLKNPRVIPVQTQIKADKEGFTVPGYEKVLFRDIKSARYQNIMRDGSATLTKLEILRTDGSVVTINEEVIEILPIFNMLLEKTYESHGIEDTQYYPFGQFRWKQGEGEYQFINDDDKRSMEMSEFLAKPVTKKFMAAGFVLFMIFVILIFIAVVYIDTQLN